MSATSFYNARGPAPAKPEVRATDVSVLIGIGRPAALFLIAGFMVSNVVFALTTLDAVSNPWGSIAGIFLVNGASVILALPHRDPLPLGWTFGIIVAVVATSAAISWQLAPSGEIGREGWFYGANTWLLFFTALRGRVALAWLGFLAMAAVLTVWALEVGRGPLYAVNALQTHAGILLVGTLFTGALQRTSRRINTLNRRSVELAADAASSDAEQDIRQQRVAELAEVATPLLTRIARAGSVTDSDRIDYLLAEATLRDSVRARALHLPEIVRATSEARRRGVEVTLLDDRGNGLPTPRAMDLLTAHITENLRYVSDGRLTIRLAPAGREAAASIVVETHEGSRRIDLNEQGEPLEPAHAP